MIKSLSIIFPVFNEQLRINNSLNKIKKFIKVSKLKYIEIIFIDDGSIDRTFSIIKILF
jgi:glycosyltransferase involved in cell wall biosynthesis